MSTQILVIDDSQTIQKVVKLSLEGESYHCLTASDYKESLKYVQNERFDLILFDFDIHDEKSGYQVAQEIRSYSQAPLLAMLGTFESPDTAQMRSSQINGHISKPFDSNKLLQFCRDLLSGKDLLDRSDSTDLIEDAGELFEQMYDEEWRLDPPKTKSSEQENASTSIMHSPETKLDTDGTGPSVTNEFESWGIDIPAVIDQDEVDLYQVMEKPPVMGGSVDAEDTSKTSTDPGQQFAEKFERAKPFNFELDDENTDDVDNQADQEKLSQVKLKGVVLDGEGDVDKSNHLSDPDQTQTMTFERNEELWQEDEPGPQEVLTSKSTSHLEFTEAPQEELRAIVERVVKEYMSQSVEKIAWEIIPDLAENLIKEELMKISKSLQD